MCCKPGGGRGSHHKRLPRFRLYAKTALRSLPGHRLRWASETKSCKDEGEKQASASTSGLFSEYREALFADFMLFRSCVSLGDLHSIFACSHSFLDNLRSSDPKATLPPCTPESVVALAFIGMALSARMQSSNITMIRILMMRMKKLEKSKVGRAECHFANSMNIMNGGLLGD